MTSEEKEDKHKRTRIIVKSIGFSVLIIGIILAITGGITMSMGWNYGGGDLFERSRLIQTGMGVLAGGIVMIMFSSFLLCLTFQGRIAGYLMDEVSIKLDSEQESDYERYEKIIEESSKRRASRGNRAGGETSNGDTNSDPIVKIKCVLCGALNEEDAKFCDQCSQPL